MKFIITICLIFIHYVCGAPCIAEKDTDLNIATTKTLDKFYKNTTSQIISETPQITQPSSRITYNKRFVKRYRNSQRLLNVCLQSTETNTSFCRYNTWQNIQSINHLFNPWLPAYLSLFAFFRM